MRSRDTKKLSDLLVGAHFQAAVRRADPKLSRPRHAERGAPCHHIAGVGFRGLKTYNEHDLSIAVWSRCSITDIDLIYDVLDKED